MSSSGSILLQVDVPYNYQVDFGSSRSNLRKLVHFLPGVYKKQLFGHSGGGKLIHFLTFWGGLIQFSHITRVKIDFII